MIDDAQLFIHSLACDYVVCVDLLAIMLTVFQYFQVGAKDANRTAPVLQCHGDIDPIVPFAWGNMTAQFLKQFNPEHKIITLNGVMHSGSPEVTGVKL